MPKNVKFSAPQLPSAPKEYEQGRFEQILNSLRLYFSLLENHLRDTDVEIEKTLTVGGTYTLNGATTVNNDLLEVISTDAGATVNPIFSLYRNSASPAASDDLGAIQFYGQDDGGNKTVLYVLKLMVTMHTKLLCIVSKLHKITPFYCLTLAARCLY